MTKDSDAKLNTLNPLYLRDFPTNGGSPLDFRMSDDNLLNLMRLAGIWEQRTYLKNEAVFYMGGVYVAVRDTALQPDPTTATDWFPLAGSSGRGGMNLLAFPAGSIPQAGFTPMPLDNVSLASNGGSLVLDPSTDSWQFLWQGVWQVSITMSFLHDESQQSRNFVARLYNITDGTPLGDGVTIPIARNQTSTYQTFTSLGHIEASELSKSIRVELGNSTGSISDVIWQQSIVDLTQQSTV